MCHSFQANKSPRLSAEERKAIAFDAINFSNVTEIAKNNQVSRNTVYAQKKKAHQAIDGTFEESDTEGVQFNLPVTSSLIKQTVLALALICKSSHRDIKQFMKDILDYPISIGSVFNILNQSASKAIQVNEGYDLSVIKQSAADEIFHRNKPVLAVVDIPSRFCAKLSKEDRRDADSWEITLMDMTDKGFEPESVIIDQAAGLSKACENQLANTNIHYDHFHLIRDSKTLVRRLKSRKESMMTVAITLFEKRDRLRDKGKDTSGLSSQITEASAEACETNRLYEQVNTLCTWLQYDVLQHASFNPEDRDQLYDFIVEELALLRVHSQIDSFVRSLIFQKKRLLSVSHTLNSHFEIIANDQGISINDVWQICYFTRFEIQADRYHFYAQNLADKLGELDYDQIEDQVIEAMAKTPRCSSMVENFNSRIRLFLDPRKQITPKRLALCQFILNHRPFQRSANDDLVGKTPAEALTQRSHPHWLEMLGYQRFQQAA